MSKKTLDIPRPAPVIEVDPLECPFREFRDTELQPDTWGLGITSFRTHTAYAKYGAKPPSDMQKVWVDEQTQPLPRSVRKYLHGWIRAENLASTRWDVDIIIAEEDNGVKMALTDVQLSHAQVLQRSSFCRRVLSACFMLERVENLIVEHQWDNFVCNLPTEGWRAKYHIYSPGLKPGGGAQHKPQLSKNGCYLVRLFYLGAWRCVWVSDQVPVDATDAPLLPFSPLITRPPATKPGMGKAPPAVIANVVHLWPLLLCKALLKLAAPDMNSDEDIDSAEDELMREFDIIHTLTGAFNMRYKKLDNKHLWDLITSEVPTFSWDEDDETPASTIKSRSTKKPTAKDFLTVRRNSMMYLIIKDSKDLPAYYLPGITPGHEMSLLITMCRDLPLKKPLPEPEVAFWKYYRWVDWARQHGLYDSYECPRTKFLKVTGLLKLSHAPHLLDVTSTESITVGFIEEHKSYPVAGKEEEERKKKQERKNKELQKTAQQAAYIALQATKEELREWIQYDPVHKIVKDIHVVYYPSMFQHTSAGSNPPIRLTKSPVSKEITAPKSAPLYLQIDGPEELNLRISLRTLNPRILSNAGIPVVDYIEPAHLVLEKFEWFKETPVPVPKAYVRTRGYETVEVQFQPGRHICRIWIHSRMNWHVLCMSDSTMLLGSRDVIQGAAIRECNWASKFLLAVGSAFTNWIKINRDNPDIVKTDREFFRSYQPDLTWDRKIVGYDRAFLHWMFRRALQSHLLKRLYTPEYKATCHILRKYFCDPDFGFPDKPIPPKSGRVIAEMDICDCNIEPDIYEIEGIEEQVQEEEEVEGLVEEKPLVDPETMEKLLEAPKPPAFSQICELATEELPCGILKNEREKMIRKIEAATVLQAHWRGVWARKCLKSHATFTSDMIKLVHDNAFGNVDALSKLMNEFFGMFPGVKYAYSIGSALIGAYGIDQHTGTAPVTPKCKWIPYFQGIFFCHFPVKVHFDVLSSIAHSTLAVFDNDTGEQLPHAYNIHITYDFQPNQLGFTVIGHGSLAHTPGINYDANWQLTIMSSIDGAFHICDNEDTCRDMPLSHASKLHLDEVYLPNRRNILGGVQISVTKHESMSFRVAATSPNLHMEATLRTVSSNGSIKVLSKCTGTGEIYWPFIRLEPSTQPLKYLSASTASVRDINLLSNRSLKGSKSKGSPTTRYRSSMKMKPTNTDPKLYTIEVVCPHGWPLTLSQWERVDEIRNSQEYTKLEVPQKKVAVKEKTVVLPQKPGSAKEKLEKNNIVIPSFQGHLPQPGDAFVELECAVSINGGVVVKRDDERDLEFANARMIWDALEPGRNLRGAAIRKEFRAEYLEAPPTEPSETFSVPEIQTIFEETDGEQEPRDLEISTIPPQRPSLATESGFLEVSVEDEEQVLYLTMPEQLKDKFVPLYFLPHCMKERNEDECVIVTPDMGEAAKRERQARMRAAWERMRELQTHNEEQVLGRQRERCQLLERLNVDAQWCSPLQEILEERDEVIAKETLNRTLSATKKRLEKKK